MKRPRHILRTALYVLVQIVASVLIFVIGMNGIATTAGQLFGKGCS